MLAVQNYLVGLAGVHQMYWMIRKQFAIFFTVKEVDHAKTSKHGLQKSSKNEINSCFNGVPLGDLKYGIMGIIPPEMLHVAGVGIFKYMFSCLSDIIGLDNNKKKKKSCSWTVCIKH